MKIKWLGHSSFLITSDDGTKIITDPYKSGSFNGTLAYGPINQSADVVTVSHGHDDHAYTSAVSGNPMIIRGAGKFVASGIEFLGVETSHDTSGGQERGKNVIYTFTVDGVKVCHLGDLGHVLNEDQAAEIGAVDVLLPPVGGFFTIGPDEVWEVADMLSAKVVVPMHFKTPKVDFPIGPVDEFVKGKANVERLDSSEVEVTADALPQERKIIVLKHAL